MSDPKKWDYAGDADTSTWHDWKDHSNNEEKSASGKSLFEYNAGPPEVGPTEFPEVAFQDNPEKM